MPTIPEALAVAVQNHQAGRLQAAEHIYRQILQFEPDHPDALHLMGVFLAQTGRLAEAEDHIRRAIRLSPDFAPFHCSLGNVLQSLTQLDAAIASYRQALRLQPDSVEAHNNLGNALQKQGQLDAAVASYQQALRYRPDYFEAHCNLGNARVAQGQLADAVAEFQQALKLNPNYATGHNELGTALQLQGQLEAAVVSYRNAIRLKPDYLEVYSKLGFALNGLGRIAEATVVWQQWQQLDPGNAMARHMVAATTGQNVPTRSTDDYVRTVFDDFARTFDKKLQVLEYRGPELINDAVTEAVNDRRGTLEILDAGCGTGLCGPLLRPFARRLTGVDLSSGMLAQARARGVYDELLTVELTQHLESIHQGYDLVVAADTLNYFGDLQPVITAAAHSLRPDGWLICTLERIDSGEDGFRLQPHGRYCHTEQYARKTLVEAGFTIHGTTAATLRTEVSQPVQGIVVSARRT